MKLVMMTPAIQASAIGRMACMVTQALTAADHEVAVVRAESVDLFGKPIHPFGTRVLPWTLGGQVERAVAEADAVVYHVGDNFAFHAGCVHWLARAPGVVCLHDFFLGHLFTGWAQERRDEATRILRSWYPDGVSEGFFGHASSAAFIAATCDAAPLTEWIASQATGVITHSSWGVGRVLASCPGPVRVVPLAYEAPHGALDPTGAPTSSGDFRILTVGNVNPNKRAESVIRAIGSSRHLQRRTVYTLAGAISDDMASGLRALAGSLNVRLDIRGEVDADTLGALLGSADAVCCLRWPTLEAASASTVEALLSGKAVVVEDAGFYAELPDACARKIRPDVEIDDLRDALEDLAGDHLARLAMGDRAAHWARATFTSANYAAHLADIVGDARAGVPALRMVRAMTEHLHRWGGAGHALQWNASMAPLRLLAGRAPRSNDTESTSP